jgi:alkyl sulfatase BDS1-like metallo-beta-lactamase superfamily hydrolase
VLAVGLTPKVGDAHLRTAGESVDATLTVARPIFLGSLFQGASPAPKIMSGEVKLEGDRAALGRLSGWFDAFPTDFPIVTRLK